MTKRHWQTPGPNDSRSQTYWLSFLWQNHQSSQTISPPVFLVAAVFSSAGGGMMT